MEFDELRNPDHDPMDPDSSEFLVGLTEDSNVSYCVAAYWNAPVTAGETFGISWGVAYTLNDELDTAVMPRNHRTSPRPAGTFTSRLTRCVLWLKHWTASWMDTYMDTWRPRQP